MQQSFLNFEDLPEEMEISSIGAPSVAKPDVEHASNIDRPSVEAPTDEMKPPSPSEAKVCIVY